MLACNDIHGVCVKGGSLTLPAETRVWLQRALRVETKSTLYVLNQSDLVLLRTRGRFVSTRTLSTALSLARRCADRETSSRCCALAKVRGQRPRRRHVRRAAPNHGAVAHGA